MSLVEELKRRNVFKVGIAYVITSWLLAQILEMVLDSFGSPEWVMKTVLVILAAGLPLALLFAWAFEMTPEGIKKEKDVDRTQSITPKTGRKLDFVIIGILTVAVIFLLYDRFTTDLPVQTDTAIQTADEEEGAAQVNEGSNEIPAEIVIEINPKSIAVLPFVNMSSDPEQEYFSDGISEEILNSLARVKELKVAGRTSSFAFKGQNQDLRQIGETLGVANILEGSVRKAGNTLRITAQLIQVKDGFHLWSDTYDRELDNVFAIQDEIATSILDQLKATLIGDNIEDRAAERTSSEVYDLYLLANQRMFERNELALQAAVALLDEAISLDPDYAPAYAQRAIATLLLRDQQYGSIPREDAWRESRLYIDKALSLDPELAEANAALGLYHSSRPGESDLAIPVLEKALANNPNLVNASNWLMSALAGGGRIEEAQNILEQLKERDPLYRPGIHMAVTTYNWQGKTDESWALIKRVSPFFPGEALMSDLKGMTLFMEGRLGDAVPMLKTAIDSGDSNNIALGWYGASLVLTGQYEAALELDEPYISAWALALLDRPEEAKMLTTKLAASGENVSDHISYLVMAGNHAEAVSFFESRWTDFDDFENDFPPMGRGEVFSFADLAMSYSVLGNEDRFQQSMLRYRKYLDQKKEFGVEDSFRYVEEAMYYTLTGDHENAMSHLARAVDKGYLGPPRISKRWVQFKPLEGDPEYEAIQARMIQHLNDERAKLNLAPMSI